jgi:inner membrane protein
MDPLTQFSLGAAVAVAVSSREQARWAVLIGGVAGAVPDLDVLIRSAADPLLTLQYHRHFSHALIVAPLIGLCTAVLFKLLLFRSKLPFRQCALFAVLGALTHGMLDACTSYGTMLYWPFSDIRESWDIISVIDPIFTLPLVLLTLFAFTWRRPRFAQAALIFCTSYFGFCGLQHFKATQVAEHLAAERGHQPEQYSIRPSFGNTMLWRMIYRFEGRYYVDAVWIGPGAEPRLYEGQSVKVFTVKDTAALVDPDSVMGSDVERFRFFSQGYVTLHSDDPLVVGDVRYAMWPDSVVPLWGIRIDPAQADQHAEMMYFRDSSKLTRERLWEMIQGREVARLSRVE